jgi:hypothetical protein
VITATQLKARFPGAFDSLADAVVDACIAEAAATILEATWGSDYDTGLLYLTAHLLERTVPKAGSPLGPAAVSGQLKRWKAGDLEVEFAQYATGGSGLESDYRSTAYGCRDPELR